MRKRTIIIYWCLLIIPSLVIGVSAVRLLRSEQARMIHEKRLTIQERARAVGDTLRLTVGAVQDELTNAMGRISPDRIDETLATWERGNPLIRNVFIWDRARGLIMPPPDGSATSEERLFIRRYRGLITGRIPWQGTGQVHEPGGPDIMAGRGDRVGENRTSSPNQVQSPISRDMQRLKSGRNKLMALAKGKVKQQAAALEESGISDHASGWIPWFEENNLYILGWLRDRQGNRIYGLELEVMALLSRLLIDFPASESIPNGMVFALVDGGGRFLTQAGGTLSDVSIKPDFTVSLAPELPHWQVSVFFVDPKAIAETGREFTILSGLLLGILILAIISGGTMLTWQAFRNQKDAQRKTSFVSSVSHELKTPLTSIRMYAELLSEGRINSAEKVGRYLQVIVSESQRLTRLVNNVLDFSRLEQGKKKYHLERIEMVGFLKEMIKTHRLQIESSGMELETTFSPGKMVLRTDRDSIEQVLLNLIDNAIKYAVSGKELLLAVDTRQDYCEIHFMDRGPGIPTGHRKEIFEKFHRVDDSITSRKPGSGLGLSIARRLLRDLGGDLQYIPRNKGGSCFTILLPLSHENRDNHKSGKP